MDPHYYSVHINWQHDRQGTMYSPEINENAGKDLCIQVATPPPFQGGVPGIWSPEHLFTAAVSSCLMTTFLAIAENSKLEFSNFACKSNGKLEQVEGIFIMSEVIVEATITIRDEKEREKAHRILLKSEAACLISNSIKAKVQLVPVIVVIP